MDGLGGGSTGGCTGRSRQPKSPIPPRAIQKRIHDRISLHCTNFRQTINRDRLQYPPLQPDREQASFMKLVNGLLLVSEPLDKTNVIPDNNGGIVSFYRSNNTVFSLSSRRNDPQSFTNECESIRKESPHGKRTMSIYRSRYRR